MSDDLGRGDVVAALHDLNVPARWTGGHGPYAVRQGQRAIVDEVRICTGLCTQCGARPGGVVGLRLVEYPLAPWVMWCPCEWRKVGGGKAETIEQFAGYLVKRPELT
jgi:hypothetical protein